MIQIRQQIRNHEAIVSAVNATTPGIMRVFHWFSNLVSNLLVVIAPATDEKVEIIITEHAYKRARERVSLGSYSIERMAVRAYREGISSEHFKHGKFKRYLDALYFKNKRKAKRISIYGDVIYFFQDMRLVTLYRVPNEFKKAVSKAWGSHKK